MKCIPLNIVVTATGQTTPDVLVAVLAADLDALVADVSLVLRWVELGNTVVEGGEVDLAIKRLAHEVQSGGSG